MSFKLKIAILLLFPLLLSACTLGRQAPAAPTAIDPAVVLTQAAQMVFSAMTQTAQAWTPTPVPTQTPLSSPTPPPLNTPAAAGTLTFPTIAPSTPLPGTPFPTIPNPNPLPTSFAVGCSNSEYAGFTDPPRGAVMKPGQVFTKIWRLKNTGTCTWDEGYALVYAGGDGDMGAAPFVIQLEKDFVKPGETKDIGVKMTAPNVEKDYGSCWRMRDDKGNLFGDTVCAWFTVKK